MNNYLALLVTSLASFIAVAWIYPKILKIAVDRNLCDKPGERKLQKSPVPVLGGVAVAFGIFVGLQAGVVFCHLTSTAFLIPAFSILSALIVMLYVGAVDDLIELTPRIRFCIEILLVAGIICGSDACIDSLHGLWGIGEFSWWIGVPLTVFASVGIINAINMIDGVNGLSSSLCILCSTLFGFVFLQGGVLTIAIINFAMAASLVPFLIHNVIGLRSKMFIGDAGTMMMGILMSYDVIQLLRTDTAPHWQQMGGQGFGLVALTIAILALPVADTLRVMTQRILRHQSPFSPDKTHLHHVLMEYSFSHAITTIVEVLIAVLVFLSWYIAYKLGGSIEVQLYVVVLAAMSLVWGLYAYLSSRRTVRTGIAWRLRSLFARLRQGETEWWRKAQEWVDGDSK